MRNIKQPKLALRILTSMALLAFWSIHLHAQDTSWKPLFNGKDLDGWITNDFAGAGEVKVENGQAIISTGIALSGFKKKEAPYTSNYEVVIEAMKIEGDDFFCGFTFPVKGEHATLIVGGWGGSLVGFSSVDGMDASENEYTQYMRFEPKKWYTIRLRVTDSKIQAWIDNERMIDADISGRKISMRAGEIESSAPFGLATFQTTAAIRAIKIREIPKNIPRIALIAGKKSHGPGEHEYRKAMQLLAAQLEKEREFIDVRVHFDGWPTDDTTLTNVNTIVLYSDGADKKETDHPLLLGRMKYFDKIMDGGVGAVFLHYSLIVPREKAGQEFLEWVGGYFDYESGNGANKWYSKIETKEFKVIPATPSHPILKGVNPFTINEEFYFNLRFAEQKEKLTPIATLDPEKKDWTKVVGWALERPNGARGFGYTGGHFLKNFEDPNVQRMLLNAILWTAKADPADLAKK